MRSPHTLKYNDTMRSQASETLHHMLHILETGLTFIEQHIHIYTSLNPFTFRYDSAAVLSKGWHIARAPRITMSRTFFPDLVSVIFLKEKINTGKTSKPFAISFKCRLTLPFTGSTSDALSDALASQVRTAWQQCDGQSAGSCFPGPTELGLHGKGTAQPLFNLCPLHY